MPDPWRAKGGKNMAAYMNGFTRQIWDAIIAAPPLGKRVVNNQIVLTYRGNGFGMGLDIEPVAVLPAIPDEGGQLVFWMSSATISGGTGDDQVWMAYAGQTEWYPMQMYTECSGAVV
jgi:hypothetical protein